MFAAFKRDVVYILIHLRIKIFFLLKTLKLSNVKTNRLAEAIVV